MHDIIVDLINSLSAVRSLSELESNGTSEKLLIRKALGVLIQNQDMERCSFFLFDGKEALINITGISSEETVQDNNTNYTSIKFKLGEGVIGIAAATGQLQQCNDTQNDSRFISCGVQSSNSAPRSLISVPVSVNHELIGVLNISHPEKNYFNDWHIRILQIYKNMLGQLIANNRLIADMEEQIAQRTNSLEKALIDVRSLKERYENLSMMDDLTGLFNRRYFYVWMETSLANSKRYHQPICLLMLDIDYFKKINDEYGHLCGDQVLIEVATSLSKQIRDSDLLVRFGGEEFIIIFTNTDCENGRKFAERIRESIAANTILFEENEIRISVSIGVHCMHSATTLDKVGNIDSLVQAADYALYQAKELGRDRVEIYHGESANHF